MYSYNRHIVDIAVPSHYRLDTEFIDNDEIGGQTSMRRVVKARALRVLRVIDVMAPGAVLCQFEHLPGRSFAESRWLMQRLALFTAFQEYTEQYKSMAMDLIPPIYGALPVDLEANATSRFDQLLAKGELEFEVPKINLIEADGWQYHFIITSSLSKKPTLTADDPGRSKPLGPFIDPPEDWIVARIGDTHKVILNKYCITRPMLILHTATFHHQTDDLEQLDLAAAWAVMRRCVTDQIIIYNCGVDAGSSQGHKHLQIYPRPDHDKSFSLWPSQAHSEHDISSDIPNIPFQHFVLRLPLDVTSAVLYDRYLRLLSAVQEAHSAFGSGGKDYNVIIVREWICLIPRSRLGRGSFVANAANMAGSFWIRDEAMQNWMLAQGLRSMLGDLGLPKLTQTATNEP